MSYSKKNQTDLSYIVMKRYYTYMELLDLLSKNFHLASQELSE